jgi:LuxR family maltose regulon positive regulatory protein
MVSDAEIAVLDELTIIETTVYHESFLSAYTVLVRAALRRGEVERALMLLNRAERLATERRWGRLVAAFLLERIRILLSEQRIDEARAPVEHLRAIRNRHPAPQRSSWSEIHIGASVADGLLRLAEGRTEEAIEILESAHNELLTTNNRRLALRVGLELSNALFLAGRRQRAFEVLDQVLEWATRAGAVSFALERPRQFRQLLVSALDEGNPQHKPFLERIISDRTLQDIVVGKAEPSRSSRQVLSQREQAIIGFIADGQSNKQIARSLGVTPETVKTHVKRIFIKLSAESRAQAVVRAQSLGLLRSVELQ